MGDLAVTAVISGAVAAVSGSVPNLAEAHYVADALIAVPLLIAFALARVNDGRK